MTLCHFFTCMLSQLQLSQLTANEHENDREDLLVVGVGCNVAETHGDETGEAKVEASAVPTLVEGGESSGGGGGEVEGGESEFSQKKTTHL